MKLSLRYSIKLAVIISTLLLSLNAAAESPEITSLIDNLHTETYFKKTIVEVNKHQLKKRLNTSNETENTQSNNVRLTEFSGNLERFLNWSDIREILVENFQAELNTEELRALNQFLKTPEGQYYADEYQDASIAIALALDNYTDTLSDNLFEDTYKPLEIVKNNDKNVTQAKKIVAALTPKGAEADFNGRLESLIGLLKNVESSLPKNKKNEGLLKKRISNLKQSFSYEQIQLRSAIILAQKMPAEHTAKLLQAINKDNTSTLLKKLSVANQKANTQYSEKYLASKDFMKMVNKLLKPDA